MTPEGIHSQLVATDRADTFVRHDGRADGEAVAFVKRLAEQDADGTDALSPRGVMRALYFASGPPHPREDDFVASMLTTRIGEDFYPGDSRASASWPNVAPGDRGILNTMAATHCDLSGLAEVSPRPPVLWLRGSEDQIVSDTSMLDLAMLGRLGAVPGWPGEDTCPPQPMVAQTRAVLDRYAAAGGHFDEVVVEGAGHSPHVERPEEFRAAFFDFLSRA